MKRFVASRMDVGVSFTASALWLASVVFVHVLISLGISLGFGSSDLPPADAAGGGGEELVA